MILCDKDCIPCCDFCVYAEHEYDEIDGKIVKLGPVGCNLHKDVKNQGYYYCDDYHCFNMKTAHAYIFGKRINDAEENTLSKERLEEIKRDLANKISIETVTRDAVETARRLAEENN